MSLHSPVELKTKKCLVIVKRAIRALHSPAYAKARSKAPNLLPEVTDRITAENTLKLLPRSLLALRVSKIDPHEGHGHGKSKKRVKGLWTVKIEQHQEMDDPEHYVWLYEGPQWKQKLYAVGALLILMALVLFPLWPIKLRIGVWYLSMGMLGLIGLFFAMSIFRLILFCVTLFAVPPGLWLYPNLFEDVGFFDSFRPVWGWQEVNISLFSSVVSYIGPTSPPSPRFPSYLDRLTNDDYCCRKRRKRRRKRALRQPRRAKTASLRQLRHRLKSRQQM